MEPGSAGGEDGGANFPASWPFVSFLCTLRWPPTQDPLFEGLLHGLYLPLSPAATVGKDITGLKGRVWRGLEKEAPSPLVKWWREEKGGRAGLASWNPLISQDTSSQVAEALFSGLCLAPSLEIEELILQSGSPRAASRIDRTVAYRPNLTHH